MTTEIVKLLSAFAAFESVREPVKKVIAEITARIKDQVYIGLWINIIRRIIAMGPEATLTALIRHTVWQTLTVTEIFPDVKTLWQALNQGRFKTVLNLDLLAQIVKIPEDKRLHEINQSIDFVIGTPETFFGSGDAEKGKHLDRDYLQQQGYDFCADYDVFKLMADPNFELKYARAFVWTQAFQHESLEGPSVFQLTQKEPFGGVISLGLHALPDSKKNDLTVPIILRISPVKVCPPPESGSPPDVTL